MSLYEKAKELYEAKIRTGKYDHYPPKALDRLWEDCVRQVATMTAINERSI
jgi:hypothetical protein